MVICTRCQVHNNTLMTLAIPAELSSIKLASYWLDAPSLTFPCRVKDQQAYEVFTIHSMTAETINLPWYFARLESFTK
jgi:hypothetical protein